MLKLINIKREKDQIEADFIPESSQEKGHAFYCANSGRCGYQLPMEYGPEYGRMAVNGLQRIAKEILEEPKREIPNERIVMWY